MNFNLIHIFFFLTFEILFQFFYIWIQFTNLLTIKCRIMPTDKNQCWPQSFVGKWFFLLWTDCDSFVGKFLRQSFFFSWFLEEKSLEMEKLFVKKYLFSFGCDQHWSCLWIGHSVLQDSHRLNLNSWFSNVCVFNVLNFQVLFNVALNLHIKKILKLYK